VENSLILGQESGKCDGSVLGRGKLIRRDAQLSPDRKSGAEVCNKGGIDAWTGITGKDRCPDLVKQKAVG